MDDHDYRLSFPSIGLPVDGNVPNDRMILSTDDFDRIVETLNNVWNSAACLLTRGGTRISDPVSESAEVPRAWHLWMQSHHGFFVLFALLAHAYEQVQVAAGQDDTVTTRLWTENVTSLWRGAGALMMFGCDFAPLQSVYCGHVRTQMPAAFSGFWLREWAVVHRRMLTWNNSVSTNNSQPMKAADTLIKAGQQVYHRYHAHVMKAAVPDGKSLAQEYKKANGCPYQITDEQFRIYDHWFRVVRVPNMTKGDFITGACRAFATTIFDITSAHRLTDEVIQDIGASIQTAVRIFGEWLGHIPETSTYYPKALRGE